LPIFCSDERALFHRNQGALG